MILYSLAQIPKYYSNTFLDIQNILLINYDKKDNARATAAEYDGAVVTYIDTESDDPSKKSKKGRQEKLDLDIDSYTKLVEYVEQHSGSNPTRKPPAVPVDTESPRALVT